MSPSKITLFIAPVPPPVHGGALAMQFLLPLAREWPIRHINSQFASGLDNIGRFSISKMLHLIRYCSQLIKEVLKGDVGTVVVTPTFYLGPFFKDAVFIWLASVVLRRRTIAWFHMDFRIMRYETRPALVRWFIRKTLLNCNRYVVVSDGLKCMLPQWIPSERVDVVANGVDVPEDLPKLESKLRSRVRVLYLSNLEENKGWKVLLMAARALCQEFPNLEFVFHGKPAFGETEEGIRREIGINDGEGRIVFGGPVFGTEKWAAFSGADVFCFPSFHEAFPLAVLEAMAAGLPIVASRVGAVADALEEGSGGYLVEPGNAAGLVAALRPLLSDNALRGKYGAYNRLRYEEHYTLAAYQERWRRWLGRGWETSALC